MTGAAKNKKPREQNPAVRENIAARKRKHQDALEKERFKMWILFGVILLFCVILLEWGGGEVEDEIDGGRGVGLSSDYGGPTPTPRESGKKKNKYQRPGAKKTEASGYSFDDPQANHVSQAIEFDKKGDRASCIKSFEAAVKFTGRSADHMNLGVAYMRAQRYDEAQQSMDKAGELDPSNPDLKDNLAALKQSMSVDPAYVKSSKKSKKKRKNKYQRVGK